MDNLDVLYPYGVASKFGHKELKISIESFKKHVSGLGKIYVIGVDPGQGIRAEYIPYQQTKTNKEAAIAEVLSYGMQVVPFLTREVVIMCDDYIATQPFHIQEMRAPAGPSLRALADKRKTNYAQALKDTSRYLLSKGCTEYHFDYHMPMIVNRYKWVDLGSVWQASRTKPFGMVCKSLYGNIYGVEPQLQADHKANKDSITLDEIYTAAQERKVISYGDKCAPLVFELFKEYL